MNRRGRVGNSIVLSKPVAMVSTGAASGGVQIGRLKKSEVESIFHMHEESYSEIDLVGPQGGRGPVNKWW